MLNLKKIKLIFILWLLVANISCSQANKNKEIRIENNYEFIAKNGDYEGLLLQSDNLYIFTHQYSKSIDKQYIKVFKRKISDSMDRALLLGEFNGRFSFVFPQENANSIIFGIRDINHNTTIVYKYSSGTFSKLFEFEKHIIWYSTKLNIFYDGYSLYKIQDNKKIRLTTEPNNTNYQLFKDKIYCFSKKENTVQLEVLNNLLDVEKQIFISDKKLNLNFRISDSGTFYFLENNIKDKTNLIRFEKGSFTTIMENLDNLSDDGFYVYKNFIGLVTFKIDENMLAGFGGTDKQVIFSKDKGKTFNNLNLNNGILSTPYLFYKDSLFIGNLSNGSLIKKKL